MRTASFDQTKTWVEQQRKNQNALTPTGIFASVAASTPNTKAAFSFVPVKDASKAAKLILVNHKAAAKTPSVSTAGVGKCVPEPKRRPRALTGPLKTVTNIKTVNVVSKPTVLPSTTPSVKPRASTQASRRSYDGELVDISASPPQMTPRSSKRESSSNSARQTIPASPQERGAYNDCSVEELRAECVERHISSRGTKKTLVKRLTTDDNAGNLKMHREPPSGRVRNESRSNTYGVGEDGRRNADTAASTTSAGAVSASVRPTSRPQQSSPSLDSLQLKLSRLRKKVAQLVAAQKDVPEKIVATMNMLQTQIKNAESESGRSSQNAQLQAKLKRAQKALAIADKQILSAINGNGNIDPLVFQRRNNLLVQVEGLQSQLGATSPTQTPKLSRDQEQARPASTNHFAEEDSIDEGEEFDIDLINFEDEDVSPSPNVGSSWHGHTSDSAPGHHESGFRSAADVFQGETSVNSSSGAYTSHYDNHDDGYNQSFDGPYRNDGGRWEATTTSNPTQSSNFFVNSKQIRDQAKAIFGHNSFRECQEDVITTVLRGNDCFVLMPTGTPPR